MKIFAYLMAIFVALPIVGTIILQFFGTAMMAGMMYKVSSEIHDAEKAEVVGNPFGADVELSGIEYEGRPKPGYIALASFAELNNYRQIEVRTYLRLKDMMDENDVVPDNDFAAAFAAARAPRMAMAECERIVKFLASECSVENAKANWNKNGLIHLSMVFKFVQKQAFGERPFGKSIYSEIVEFVDSSGNSRSTSFSKAASLREEIYQRTATKCDKLRKLTGNCALFRLALVAELRTPDQGALGVSARAVFSTVQSQ